MVNFICFRTHGTQAIPTLLIHKIIGDTCQVTCEIKQFLVSINGIAGDVITVPAELGSTVLEGAQAKHSFDDELWRVTFNAMRKRHQPPAER